MPDPPPDIPLRKIEPKPALCRVFAVGDTLPNYTKSQGNALGLRSSQDHGRIMAGSCGALLQQRELVQQQRSQEGARLCAVKEDRHLCLGILPLQRRDHAHAKARMLHPPPHLKLR